MSQQQPSLAHVHLSSVVYPMLQGGWNPCALAAVVLGVAPCLPGLLASVGVLSSVAPVLAAVYDCGWFVGVAVSSVVYAALMRLVAGGQRAGGRGEGGSGSVAAAG